MNNLNPTAKLIKSNGVDLPIMTVYLAGRISGDLIDKCLGWRKQIVNYYKNYKSKGQYPISFLCPLNSGEADTVDLKGLTSHIPSNLIYAKDLLSVQHADIIVANMEDYFEENIVDILDLFEENFYKTSKNLETLTKEKLISIVLILMNKILNRRENIGTVMEVAWGLFLNKPVILIVSEKRKEIFEKHPFTKRASIIVTSVEQLLEEKWLNLLYKSIAGAIY